jgi:hypothetical protein
VSGGLECSWLEVYIDATLKLLCMFGLAIKGIKPDAFVGYRLIEST